MFTEFLMNDDTSCVSTASIRRLAPFDIVHQSHCRLLGWGLTTPWCWLMWGSETNVHFETVIQIVSMRISLDVFNRLFLPDCDMVAAL